MSIFFELPMHLREQWWSANTLEEREAVESVFRKTGKSLCEPEYNEALKLLGIEEWPELKTKLASTQVIGYLRSYLAAFRAEREAWKGFDDHSILEAQNHTRQTLDDLNAVL